MLPTFLVIGAMKSGTTTLYNLLGQHPEIFMSPVKEAHFFLHEDEKMSRVRSGLHTTMTLEEYEELFAGAAGYKALGEASPGYMDDPFSAELIKERLPEVKLVAILRNPLQRAYSHFNHNRYYLFEDGQTSFAQAIDRELSGEVPLPEWMRYVDKGMYFQKLSRFLQVFRSDQILILLLDDLVQSPQAVMAQLLEFLEVDASFVPDFSKRSPEGFIPNNVELHRISRNLRQNKLARLVGSVPLVGTTMKSMYGWFSSKNKRKAEVLNKGVAKKLASIYAGDVEALGRLISRDLSFWLSI